MFSLDTRCRVPGCTFVAVAYLAPGPDGEPEIFIGTPSRLEHFPVCQNHLDVDKRRKDEG